MKSWIKAKKKQLKNYVFTFVTCAGILLMQTETMWAINQAEVDAFMQPFNTLMYVFTTLASSLGTLYTLWCIIEWGLAWHESQGNVGGQSFKRMFGGLVMIMAPQLLSVLT